MVRVLAFVAFDLLALTLVICITYRWFFKRVWEFLVSLVCLIVTSPLFLLVYLRARRAKARGELKTIVEKTRVVGKKGKTVSLHSFVCTGEGSYCKWLKSTKFYALPRLFDVFCGRIGIIGVKPFSESDCVFLSDTEEDRHIAKPGLINPLVKKGNKETDYEEMLLSDKKYAWNFSFFGDIGIFFNWLLKKIRGEGNEFLGETRNGSYAEYLLKEERITQADYEEAVAE
ncbi:MAG: sugar transferase [Clostridia bacterium]|nr:sugar transferase [Clostridia bacterium]